MIVNVSLGMDGRQGGLGQYLVFSRVGKVSLLAVEVSVVLFGPSVC